MEKEEGRPGVPAGEVLAEIETDKATMEWESPEDGTLTEIYVEDGGKVNVGDRIAFIGGRRRGSAKARGAAPGKREAAATAEEKEKKPQAETEERVGATVSTARDEAQQQKKKLNRKNKTLSNHA